MKSEEQILTIVKRNIAECIAEPALAENITPETRLAEELQMDEIDKVHLSALLGCDKELRLTVCILDKEALRWKKIGDVVKLVQKRLPRSVRTMVS